MRNTYPIVICILLLGACSTQPSMDITVFETSASGSKMEMISVAEPVDSAISIKIDTSRRYQAITGIGGSFTESSAYLLNRMSPQKRQEVLKAYFSEEGANYSLTRTHIGSCDFSLSNYSYAPIPNDMELEHFTIDEDRDDLIPMIKDAMTVSPDGFKIISSPWTAPPWMKDNNNYVGGKLLPKYYATWAKYYSRYLNAYRNEGIDIWGITVVNEPHGNGNNWESMHFSPKEMTDFVSEHLGPQLAEDGLDVNVLGYDQNRAGLKEWVDEMYRDEVSTQYFDGTAIHWYESTYEVFPEALGYAHQKAPDKYLIETEGCIDSEVPKWKDDQWYWSKEATDWGWDWASDEDKYLHPKYAPVNRYARDIIGCLNNWVDGWIDWNMVLDRQGGPNWFENWCGAPVLVDTAQDEVYYTPLYYVMAHFSKFIRPGAVSIGLQMEDESLQATAVENPNGEVVVVIFNEEKESKNIELSFNGNQSFITISAQAIQTIVIPKT